MSKKELKNVSNNEFNFSIYLLKNVYIYNETC